MKKNITEKEILMSAFNFQYAGVCCIFITLSRNKYTVCTSGFSIDDNIVFFNPKMRIRQSYPTLFLAIKKFNDLVMKITSTVDWFDEKFFSLNNIKKYLNKNVY